MAQYLFDFVPPLLDILKNTERDRYSKLQAIVALGDLAMNCGSEFASKYLQETLRMLDSASKLSLKVVSESEDEYMAEYLKELRDTLIECYTSIVHGITLSKVTQPLID